MQEEIWKDIPGYERFYKASSLGRIKSVERWIKREDGYSNHILERIVRQYTTKSDYGYLRVGLHKDGRSRTCLVHRLIAMAFLPNPNNLPQVNHKNEVITDNRAENLEWCDSEYNVHYGTCLLRGGLKRRNRKDMSKPVSQYTKEGAYVATYPSSVEAYRQTGICYQTIWRVMNGRGKTAGGYIWKYSRNDVN